MQLKYKNFKKIYKDNFSFVTFRYSFSILSHYLFLQRKIDKKLFKKMNLNICNKKSIKIIKSRFYLNDNKI